MGERPLLGDRGITLTLALSCQGRGDWTPPPRFLAGPRNDRGEGGGECGRDGMAMVGRPLLDPSTVLRVSGPSLGMGGITLTPTLSHRRERG